MDGFCVSEGCTEIAAFAAVGGAGGLELFLTEALLSGTGAFYAPHSRLRQRELIRC